nr:protein VASP homolog [Saimiri boliviensis boliviensis]
MTARRPPPPTPQLRPARAPPAAPPTGSRLLPRLPRVPVPASSSPAPPSVARALPAPPLLLRVRPPQPMRFRAACADSNGGSRGRLGARFGGADKTLLETTIPAELLAAGRGRGSAPVAESRWDRGGEAEQRWERPAEGGSAPPDMLGASLAGPGRG